jgi:predicted nucleic acid-binding protein
MARRISKAEVLFLDTSYAIALSSVTDSHHPRAVELAAEIQTQGARLITTQPVVLEIGNSLSKLRFRAAAVTLLEAIEGDPNVEVFPTAAGKSNGTHPHTLHTGGLSTTRPRTMRR